MFLSINKIYNKFYIFRTCKATATFALAILQVGGGGPNTLDEAFATNFADEISCEGRVTPGEE